MVVGVVSVGRFSSAKVYTHPFVLEVWAYILPGKELLRHRVSSSEKVRTKSYYRERTRLACV
ncbi:hypothetical protein HVTV-2_gp15 [Haloarcula virus HVTV-2]|uniref:Uncharacterized protein n=1 Tax=Haloarcula vallismortis tailed virus 1 TaxID=1262528 RepID=L7TH46_9CAUD|nr:hypothetical protein HVTV1_15 [Haloarcula vallismortis tailed virus 1]AGC34544.1 hypothetical protein HVTV1_15 [Haloarcula vallismortis tailed virus 1]UBF22822.1 hypothetical protein HVTV-2_gp15 [Haloarcula virus HVTV-2]